MFIANQNCHSDCTYSWVPNKRGGPNEYGGWNIRKINKRGGRNEREEEGGRGGNFDKIKRKGLFVNETQFYH